MNEHLSDILAAVTDNSLSVSEADVIAVIEKYPFFTLPAVMLLRSHGQQLVPEIRDRLRELIALNAPDARTLALISDPACEEWINFYPVDRPQVTTESVIDTFLDTYGRTSPKEEALLERLIFNPTPDYSSILAREEEMSLPEAVDPASDSQDALINAFILSQRGEQPQRQSEEKAKSPVPSVTSGSQPMPERDHPQAAAAVADNTSLTESLAKIYIRQKRYDKAFEIIHTLSLKNPKKSAYFADQLRYLRKLMLVQELRQQ